MDRPQSKLRDTLISAVITIAMLTIVNFLIVRFSPVLFKQSVIPRNIHKLVDPCYLTFYHDTHDGTFRNWVAVLGDSYGAGSGDEFLDGKAEYGIFHKLRSRTRKNYLVFARGGFGSVNEVREFRQCMSLINDTWLLPRIEPPSEALFLFYEGNDLNNNLNHLRARGTPGRIDLFVNEEISNQHGEWRRRIRLLFPLYDVLWGELSRYSRGLWRGIRTSLHMASPGSRNRAYRNDPDLESMPGTAAESTPVRQNYAIVDHRALLVPVSPESASAELTGDLAVPIQIFYESVLAVSRSLPHTPVTIVYLPSVVTTYTWKDPIQVKAYHTGKPVFTNTVDNENQSRWIRQSIGEFATTNHFRFVDTTAALQAAARTEPVHGPRDWRHYNAVGYGIVAQTIAGSPAASAPSP